ncbi:MAG TPA: universal stress protein [Acidimicrobiales bacterium]|nr:universal stress protein [Acidimicrobiales bacterium]
MIRDPEVGRIVVGVDGSPGSVAALRWAVAEATRRQASVEVVGAWSFPLIAATPFVPTAGYSWADLKEAVQQVVDRAVSQLDPHPDVTVTTKVMEGSPARVLLDEAAGAELLVVGTRGLGGAAELFLGSTSHACAHRSPVPVVIVPADR